MTCLVDDTSGCIRFFHAYHGDYDSERTKNTLHLRGSCGIFKTHSRLEAFSIDRVNSTSYQIIQIVSFFNRNSRTRKMNKLLVWSTLFVLAFALVVHAGESPEDSDDDAPAKPVPAGDESPSKPAPKGFMSKLTPHVENIGNAFKGGIDVASRFTKGTFDSIQDKFNTIKATKKANSERKARERKPSYGNDDHEDGGGDAGGE